MAASDNHHHVWGILIPLDKSVSGKIELRKKEYTFGTEPFCDYEIIPDPNHPHPYFKDYSEVHFRLDREETESESFVYIHDLSDKGTYVNGKKIGKHNKRVLEPDAEISLVSVDNKAFIYIEEQPEDLIGIPEVIRSSYIVSKILGRGAFGKVRLLFTQDGLAKVAMKCVDKVCYEVETEKSVLKEIEIMVQLKHPCIIEVIEAHNTPNCLYIVMELAEAGTLNTRLRQYGRLEERITRLFVYQILMAVHYLHDQGITHRDLKPDNILLASRSHETLVKVTDFGVSKVVDNETVMKTLAGTPCYIAPEIWRNQILTGIYSNSVDVWSIGIILYQCIIGDVPVKASGRGQYCRDLLETFQIQTKFDSYIWTKMPFAEDLGRRLLKVEPADRILVSDALRHSWFQNDYVKRKIEELTGLRVLEPEAADHKQLEQEQSRTRSMNPTEQQSAYVKKRVQELSGGLPQDVRDTATCDTSSPQRDLIRKRVQEFASPQQQQQQQLDKPKPPPPPVKPKPRKVRRSRSKRVKSQTEQTLTQNVPEQIAEQNAGQYHTNTQTITYSSTTEQQKSDQQATKIIKLKPKLPKPTQSPDVAIKADVQKQQNGEKSQEVRVKQHQANPQPQEENTTEAELRELEERQKLIDKQIEEKRRQLIEKRHLLAEKQFGETQQFTERSVLIDKQPSTEKQVTEEQRILKQGSFEENPPLTNPKNVYVKKRAEEIIERQQSKQEVISIKEEGSSRIFKPVHPAPQTRHPSEEYADSPPAKPVPLRRDSSSEPQEAASSGSEEEESGTGSESDEETISTDAEDGSETEEDDRDTRPRQTELQAHAFKPTAAHLESSESVKTETLSSSSAKSSSYSTSATKSTHKEAPPVKPKPVAAKSKTECPLQSDSDKQELVHKSKVELHVGQTMLPIGKTEPHISQVEFQLGQPRRQESQDQRGVQAQPPPRTPVTSALSAERPSPDEILSRYPAEEVQRKLMELRNQLDLVRKNAQPKPPTPPQIPEMTFDEAFMALETQQAEPEVIFNSLDQVEQMLQAEDFNNHREAIMGVLLSMRKHPYDDGIQMMGSSCLFLLLKGKYNENLTDKNRSDMLSALLDCMENYPDNAALTRSCLAGLGEFDIPYDTLLDIDRVVQLLVKVASMSYDPGFVQLQCIPLALDLVDKVSFPHPDLTKPFEANLGAVTVHTMLEIIEERLQITLCDSVMETAWSVLWNITYDTPENCVRFLTSNGQDLFLDSMMMFHENTNLHRNMLGLMSNLADAKYVKTQLLRPEAAQVLGCICEKMASEETDISYFACSVMARLVADGPATWRNTTLSYTETCHSMIQAIASWKMEKHFAIYRGCSLSAVLKLLSSSSSEAQYWAVWTICNLMVHNSMKYCLLFERDGGRSKMEGLIRSSTSDVIKELAGKSLEIYRHYKITQKSGNTDA